MTITPSWRPCDQVFRVIRLGKPRNEAPDRDKPVRFRKLTLGLCIACFALVGLTAAMPASAQLLSVPLPDIQGTNLDVFEVRFDPNQVAPSTTENHKPGHRHPGSVLIYVIEGALRLALEGEPVRIVEAGKTFFEPAGVYHIITENASATSPARALIVMLIPEGAERNVRVE